MSGRRGPDKTFTLIQSGIVAVASTIDLDGIDASKPHCFAGLQFFADAQGSAPAIPGAGTVSIDILTLNTTPVFEDPPGNIINATALGTISWAANTLNVRATPTGITVATHYRLVVTCNET